MGVFQRLPNEEKEGYQKSIENETYEVFNSGSNDRMKKTLFGFFFVFLLTSCGGGANDKVVGLSSAPKYIIPAAIDLGVSCAYIGENRYFSSLDVFCSLNDFNEFYPNRKSDGLYFKLENRDILIAPFIGKNFQYQNGRISSREELRDIFNILVKDENYIAELKILRGLEAPCEDSVPLVTVETRNSGPQKIYEYCSSLSQKKEIAVIYMEGHGGGAIDIGVDHMEFIASRGYRVFYLDLPLTISHNDLGVYEQVSKNSALIYSEFIHPVGRFIDYLRTNNPDVKLMLYGRSGGGWRSYIAGSIYDVDYVVSVSGGTPHSMRLSAPWTVYELGDWEQWSPGLYSVIDHADFMRFSGLRGAAFVFNLNDPCCFRVAKTDPFFSWLNTVRSPNVSAYVDERNPDHSLGPDGKLFLTNIFSKWGL